jgi:hypothetical protein
MKERIELIYGYYVKLHKLKNADKITHDIFYKTEQFLKSGDDSIQDLAIQLIDKYNN